MLIVYTSDVPGGQEDVADIVFFNHGLDIRSHAQPVKHHHDHLADKSESKRRPRLAGSDDLPAQLQRRPGGRAGGERRTVVIPRHGEAMSVGNAHDH